MLQRASLLLYYYCCYFVVVAVRQRKKKKVVSTCQFNHLTGLVSLLHEETTGARFTNLAKKENEKKKKHDTITRKLFGSHVSRQHWKNKSKREREK